MAGAYILISILVIYLQHRVLAYHAPSGQPDPLTPASRQKFYGKRL